MVILLILIALFILGLYLCNTRNYAFLGFILSVVFGIYLVIHILMWSINSFKYKNFVTKRDAFEQTLKDSRLNGNPYESAAIMKEVADWNIKLASMKYQNTLFLAKDYINDKVDNLEPIK